MKKYLFLLLFAASSLNVEAQSITTNPTSFPLSTSLNPSRYYTVKEVQNAVSATKNSEIGLFSNFFIPDGNLKSALPKIASLDTLKMAGIFGAQTIAKKRYKAYVNQYGTSGLSPSPLYENTINLTTWTRVGVGDYFAPSASGVNSVFANISLAIPSRNCVFYYGTGGGGSGFHVNCYTLTAGAYAPTDMDTGFYIDIFEP
jgi:hypothetical protein